MARRGAAIEIEWADDLLKLRSKGRVLTIANAAQAGDEDDAEFLVLLDDLQCWDAPDEATAIEIEELQKILEAIEDFGEKRGLAVSFE